MNITETILLLRKIKAYKPAQQMDEYTPDAWAEILEHVGYADASEAVKQLAGEIAFIGCDDVAKRVRHLRARRIEDGFADLIPPRELSTADWPAWCQAARKRLGDGETAEQINGPQPELKARSELRMLGRSDG